MNEKTRALRWLMVGVLLTVLALAPATAQKQRWSGLGGMLFTETYEYENGSTSELNYGGLYLNRYRIQENRLFGGYRRWDFYVPVVEDAFGETVVDDEGYDFRVGTALTFGLGTRIRIPLIGVFAGIGPRISLYGEGRSGEVNLNTFNETIVRSDIGIGGEVEGHLQLARIYVALGVYVAQNFYRWQYEQTTSGDDSSESSVTDTLNSTVAGVYLGVGLHLK